MNGNKSSALYERIRSVFAPNRRDIVNTLTHYSANNTDVLDSTRVDTPEVTGAFDATLEVWATTLAMRKKNKEIEGHIQRVTEMTVTLARTMGFGEQELVHVRRGALLHDIGEMCVPESILLKSGPLLPDERDVMRKHPTYAYEMLSPIKYLAAGPGYSVLPPRALGWHRLSARADGRTNSAGGAHLLQW